MKLPIRGLADFDLALKELSAPQHTKQKLFRGQGEAWPLLPQLFRAYVNNPIKVMRLEIEMLLELKRAVPNQLRGLPKNDWDWLSFGQHYRLPTRLLDWSSNPHIALFFAVREQGSTPTVFVYHAQSAQIITASERLSSPFKVTKTKIMEPSPHSDRVAIQKGWHTVHRLHEKDSGGFQILPLQKMKWHDGRITQLRIDSKASDTIRAQLANKGICDESVFCEFDKVSANIIRKLKVQT